MPEKAETVQKIIDAIRKLGDSRQVEAMEKPKSDERKVKQARRYFRLVWNLLFVVGMGLSLLYLWPRNSTGQDQWAGLTMGIFFGMVSIALTWSMPLEDWRPNPLPLVALSIVGALGAKFVTSLMSPATIIFTRIAFMSYLLMLVGYAWVRVWLRDRFYDGAHL